MCLIACNPSPNSIYWPFPCLFAAVSQSYVKFCFLDCSPHFAPDKTLLANLTLCICFNLISPVPGDTTFKKFTLFTCYFQCLIAFISLFLQVPCPMDSPSSFSHSVFLSCSSSASPELSGPCIYRTKTSAYRKKKKNFFHHVEFGTKTTVCHKASSGHLPLQGEACWVEGLAWGDGRTEGLGGGGLRRGAGCPESQR